MAKTSVAETKTDICNLALIQDGADLITSLNDGTPNAELCSRLLPIVTDICLTRIQWTGVTAFADLGNETTVAEKASWEFVFNLPPDCLSVVAQIAEGAPDKHFKHQIVGKQLFTNALTNDDGDSAYIEYISISDVSKYSPQLIQYIALKLAIAMAPKLLGISEASAIYISTMKRDMRVTVLPEAIGANQAEGDDTNNNEEGDETWIKSRNITPRQ